MRELAVIENKKMNYNKYIYGLLALLLLTIPNFSPAVGPTEESGVISADKTWKLSNSPTLSRAVSSGTTLTIEAGVIVKFAGYDNLVINETLIAEGTANNLITFTSNQTFKSAGNWGEIQFRDTSVDKKVVCLNTQ